MRMSLCLNVWLWTESFGILRYERCEPTTRSGSTRGASSRSMAGKAITAAGTQLQNHSVIM
jgi:hypothetical protein